MKTDVKESKGQAEMDETGDKLDESQQGQLDDFMEYLDDPAQEKEEDLEAAKVLEEELGDEKKQEEEDAETEKVEEEADAEEADESTEEDLEDEEKEEEDVDEMISIRAELEENKRLLAQLQAQDEVKEEKIKVEIDPDTLISKEEAQEFLTDPHKVLKTLAERVYVKAREDTLRDIPQLVESGARRQTALNQAREKFWTENADLLDKAKSVPAVDRLIRMTANELQADNPAWTVGRIFDETGKQVRAAISLSKKAQQIEEEVTKGKRKKSSNQPIKPRGKRKSPPKGEADQRSGLQKDLDDMLSIE